MVEGDLRRRLYAAKDVAGVATTFNDTLAEPVKFAVDPSGETIRVLPTPSGARRRALTPGAPIERPYRGGMAVSPLPAAEAGASQTYQAVRPQARQFMFCAFGACFAAAGLFFVALSMGTDRRGDRLAVFREFSRRSEAFPSLPLPATLQSQPPRHLRALWQPGSAQSAAHFQLGLLEVPLTADVLGDAHQPSDEVGLLPFANSTDGYGKSKFYRAVVPIGDLWLAGLDLANRDLATISSSGILRIFLPDGSLLIEHTFEPLRWLHDVECSRSTDGSSCQGLSIAARLCYALPAGDGPWNGAETYDCEHSHRSPVYIPLQRHRQHHHGDVEVIVRSRTDVYVHASEVTRGCSNCRGRPYGSDSSTGGHTLACGVSSDPEEHGVLSRVLDFAFGGHPCFGHSIRRVRSVGLSMLAFSFLLLAITISMKSL